MLQIYGIYSFNKQVAIACLLTQLTVIIIVVIIIIIFSCFLRISPAKWVVYRRIILSSCRIAQSFRTCSKFTVAKFAYHVVSAKAFVHLECNLHFGVCKIPVTTSGRSIPSYVWSSGEFTDRVCVGASLVTLLFSLHRIAHFDNSVLINYINFNII